METESNLGRDTERVMRRLICVCAVATIGLFGLSCGPMNGKELTELNDKQGERLCEQMKNKSEDCDDGEFEIQRDCDDYNDEVIENLPDDCAATVGDAKDCAAACGANDNAGCQALVGCAFAGG